MIQELIGNTLILVSVFFVFAGLFGVLRFPDFYSKLLASSKIDTAAVITLIVGVSIRGGISWFTLKSLLILVFVLFLTPVITSKIIMSARQDGQSCEEHLQKGGDGSGD